MSFTFTLRPILSKSSKSILAVEKLVHFGCSFHHITVSNYVTCQRYSRWKATKNAQGKKYPFLTGVINNQTLLNQIDISQSLSGIPTTDNDKDSEQEEEKDKKEGILGRNFIRRDRQESAELFRNLVREKGETRWNFQDWIQLSEQLSSQFTGSWEVMCMHTLLMDSNVEVGRSLMKFLETRSEPINQVITVFFIGLLGKTCNADEKQEREMKKYYDDLVSVTDVFDAASIEVLVEGLSNTKFYKECVNLLEICRLTSQPGLSLLRNILRAAMRHNDNEFLEFVLHQFENEPTQLIKFVPDTVNIAFESKNQVGLEKFFSFMQKHSLSFVKDQLELVLETFQRTEPGQWQGSFGFVNYRSGKCSICEHRMPRIHIKDHDFEAVRSAFLDQVIVSNNIFYKSSPEEVNNFIKYVDKFGPFDIVIDGLNAIHARNPKTPDGTVLRHLVSHFNDEGKSVLILGSRVLRPYVKNFPSFNLRPAVYMTTTTRADDAFFLYAALHSGKNTLIVSADKLRDHKFRLEPQLRPIFHQWLMSNQVYNFFDRKTNAINPKRHLFNLGPKKDDNGWHIPVNDSDMKRSFGRQGILCLRHGQDNFKQQKKSRPQSFKSNRSHHRSKNFTDREWFEL